MLVQRLGFREGLAKRFIRINYQWEDHVRWSMTLEDFEPLTSRLPSPSRRREGDQVAASGVPPRFADIAQQADGEGRAWRAPSPGEGDGDVLEGREGVGQEAVDHHFHATGSSRATTRKTREPCRRRRSPSTMGEERR
jgi:hypothetical protein